MPIFYQIDSEQGRLFIVAEGDISQAERLAAMQAWLSDPDFRPGLHTLADFSDATNVPSLSELEEIAAFIRPYAKRIGQIKIAIVTKSAVTFGVARQFSALAPGEFLTVRV